MDSRILLVDDDVALLRSLERNLCFDYAVTTADSGQAALDVIAGAGAFNVIVTDMRMPGMDGVAFIEAARVRTPRSVFLMLTGNQDVETAIKAVNDGHVFRFLNKPCEIAEIKRAIDAAIRQYDLVQAEKELLQKTFVGAVNVLTDVIDALRPEVSQQSDQIDAVMRTCEEGMGFCGPWEFRLAARLGLLGLALQSVDQQNRFRSLTPADPESDRLFKEIATTSAKLIERIPRLDRVADVIRMQCSSDGALTEEAVQSASTASGGLLLRVATQWTFMMNAGLDPEAALIELRESLPDLPPRLCCALLSTEVGKENAPGRSVTLENLREGMVLHDNILSDDGALLLRKGRRLTLPVIEKLKSHGATPGGIREIVIVDTSAKLVEV